MLRGVRVRQAGERRALALSLTVAGSLLGLAVVALGLLLPWLHVPLETPLHAKQLKIQLGALPLSGKISYFTAIAVLGVGTALALAVPRTRHSALPAIAGGLIALACIFFVVDTVVGDYALQQMMRGRVEQLNAIASNAGYAFPSTDLDSVGFLPLPSPWNAYVTALRPGWYLALAGALVLIAANAAALTASVRRLPRRSTLIGAGIAAGAVLALAPAIVANIVLSGASATALSGDYTTAASRLDLALRLNPEMASNPAWEYDMGSIELGSGNTVGPLALYASGINDENRNDSLDAIVDLRAANAADPSNDVIREAYAEELHATALSSDQAASALTVALGQPGFDDPGSEYMAGLALYDAGDFTDAITHFAKVTQLVQDEDEVDSAAFTGIGLAEEKLGRFDESRRDLITAMRLDVTDDNNVARGTLLGLYDAGSL